MRIDNHLSKTLAAAVIVGFAAGSFAVVQAYDGKHVNGKAVSVKWRQMGWEGGADAQCGDGDFFTDGSICAYTIQDSRVTHEDTIFDRRNGLAVCPSLDLTGTRVAFYREGRAPSATSNNCVDINGGKGTVSVINFDGTGLRDLCQLTNDPSSGENFPLDWPAGEWIYFLEPRSSGGVSADVWKVNAVTGEKQHVCQYGAGSVFRRFTLDLTATHMAVQVLDDNASNTVHNFPGGCNLSAICSRPGCNIGISPSGQLIGSYFSGTHEDLYINWGVGTTHQSCTDGVAAPNLNRDLEAWAGEELGAGSEHIRWAVNSDKWVLQAVGWRGHAADLTMGSNQVVCNWTDQVAFNISRNPRPTTVLRFNNCTGDMWVSDPVNNPNANKYEDLQGVWHTVAGATSIDPDRRESIRMHDGGISLTAQGQIRVNLSGAGVVRVMDLRGKTVRRIAGSGVVLTDALPAGSYAVKVDGMRQLRTAKVVVR